MITISSVIPRHQAKLDILIALKNINTDQATLLLAELIRELDPGGAIVSDVNTAVIPSPVIHQLEENNEEKEEVAKTVIAPLDRPIKNRELRPLRSGWTPIKGSQSYKVIQYLQKHGPTTSRALGEFLDLIVTSQGKENNRVTPVLCMLRERGYVQKPTKKSGPWTLTELSKTDMLPPLTSETVNGKSETNYELSADLNS